MLVTLETISTFNSVRRDSVAEALVAYAPELMQFFLSSYQEDSYLKFRDHYLDSSEGLQQGDPLAPLLFCITLQQPLHQLYSTVKIGYLDDITLIDSWDVVLEDVSNFQRQCTGIGLQLNPTKCELSLKECEDSTIKDAFLNKLSGLQLVDLDHAVLLGSAVGGKAIPRCLEALRHNLTVMKRRLEQLDSHSSLFLLKNCFALPRLQYSLRTMPSFLHPSELRAIDLTVRETFEAVVNVSVEAAQLDQLYLPTKLAGFGIGSAFLTSSAAFIASYTANVHMVSRVVGEHCEHPSYDLAVSHFEDISNSKLPTHPSKQRDLCATIYKHRFGALLQSSTESGTKRLHGAAAPGAGAWLEAIPAASLGLHLSPDQVRTAVALRVGSTISSPYRCKCGAQADGRGYHALCCNCSSSRHIRHSLINAVIHRAFNAAKIGSILEPVGLSPNDALRPDGVTMTAWKSGRQLVWDATCTHRLATSYDHVSSAAGASVAKLAEARKLKKYEELGQHYVVQPLAIETLGGIGPLSMNFIRQLAKKLYFISYNALEASFIRQRLSVAVQVGNAACVAESLGLCK